MRFFQVKNPQKALDLVDVVGGDFAVGWLSPKGTFDFNQNAVLGDSVRRPRESVVPFDAQGPPINVSSSKTTKFIDFFPSELRVHFSHTRFPFNSVVDCWVGDVFEFVSDKLFE